MSRRRLEEAILHSKELGSSGESIEEGSDEDERFGELFVRHRIPLTKDLLSIYSLCFSPSAKQLAVGFGNGAIQIVNTESGSLASTLFSGHRTRQAITSLRYHPKNSNVLVAAGADGLISFYDVKSEINVHSLKEPENEIHALDYNKDGSVFATAGKDRNIRLYDSHTNEIVNTMVAPDFLNGDDLSLTSGHTRRIFALRFHPSEYHIFLTGGWDDSIKVWDKRMAKEARKVINGPHICGPGIDIRNNYILTASWVAHNALQLWDFRTTSLIQNIPFPASILHGEFLYTARFCTNNVVLAGGSGTCSARAINFKTQESLGEVTLTNKAVQVVDSASGGQVVAVAGVGGNLHIAELC
ncbi:GATOR2 complex protein WDR24-like [Gastrophryne carolinensis]